MSAPRSRVSFNRRTLLRAGAGMAGILATGRAPAFAQTQPKKLVFAHINAVPESAAVAFDWMAKEVTARSKGALEMQFFGKTLIPQELEIMNAVKSGSVAMGSPAGAAATVFPEMGALLSQPRLLLLDEPLGSLDEERKVEILPYLVRLRDEAGVPMVYVSHDAGEMRQLATQIVMLRHGRVTAFGGVEVLPGAA